MAIDVTCECGKGYRVSDGKAGKRFKCRDCGTLLQVPNANDGTTDDEGDGDDDVEMEPDAEYVSSHRLAVAKARSSKKSARDRKRAAVWKKWSLIGGGVAVGVSLIVGGLVWANAVLPPEQRNLLWFTIGIPAFFVLGDQLRRYSIRNALESCGETVQSISWRPFKNFFNLNGAGRLGCTSTKSACSTDTATLGSEKSPSSPAAVDFSATVTKAEWFGTTTSDGEQQSLRQPN